MTTTTSKYNISNIKQLIDLNGKAVNFLVNFKAVSLSNENFDALVVTQEMLDSNEPLTYQKAQGEISGQIKNDNSIYNNYFLCIKSDKPNEIEVSINIQAIQPSQPPLPPPQQTQRPQQQPLRRPMEESFNNDDENDDRIVVKKPKDLTFYYILGGAVFLAALIIGFGIYYYMKKQAESSASSSSSFTSSAVVVPQVQSKVDDMIKDGFNNLGEKISKLNEVTSLVTDGLNQVKTKVTDDFGKMHQELRDKIVPPSPAPLLDTHSDLADIKKSIADIQKNFAPPPPPPVVVAPVAAPAVVDVPVPSLPSLEIDTGMIHNNADEVLSRINSMKIKA